MDYTLEKSSNIWIIKSKFFIYRVVSYFSFLLIPVYLQKSLQLSPLALAFFMSLYIFFVISQWFLLGKEIDHRLKIYFRVNSSLDRIIYRLFLGMFFFIIYFNLLSMFDAKWANNFFWITWVLLGLFYSWPTRGKIIQESVSSNFGEFRFLDRFEKTLVFLSFITFIFSFPEIPNFSNPEALKLYFDPGQNAHGQLWNFLALNFSPFRSYPFLFKLGWSLHFYIIGVGTFLLLIYALMRYFVSRRLSLLGVFAVVSAWSFYKILANHIEYSFITTFSLLWVWSLLWGVQSSTYRSGLFMGLVIYWGSLLNTSFALLIIPQIFFVNYFFLNDKTSWYRKQILKYCSFGFVLAFLVFLNHYDSIAHLGEFNLGPLQVFLFEMGRKAFYALAPLGFVVLVLKMLNIDLNFMRNFRVEHTFLSIVLFSLVVLGLGAIFIDYLFLQGFTVIWPIAFLSVLPIELLFQTISRLRSSRNMIYLIYILICLLDSHFEGRVKLFLKIFKGL